MANLEEVLRDLAKRGEISHISLVPSQNGKLWRASFAMCSHFGISFAEDADPAKAIILACTSAKLKKPRASITAKPDRVDTRKAAPEPEEDPLADLM
jgi:hypothetical protein